MDNKEKSLRYINFPVMEENLYNCLVELGAKIVWQQNGLIVASSFHKVEQALQAKEIAADDFDRQFVVRNTCLFSDGLVPNYGLFN